MVYKKGRIYKIIHCQSDITYIGSTFNELRYRFKCHKDNYGKWKNGKSKACVSIFPYFEKFDPKNFKIVLIKEYEVCDRNHLTAYEQLWMNKMKCINEKSAFRIKDLYHRAYRISNKDKISNSHKRWREKNKDVIAKKEKLYRENNKERLENYNKEYYQNNIDKISQQKKEYRQTNIEKVKEYDRKRGNKIIQCKCGIDIKRNSYYKHLKTKKHLLLMELQ